jgi:hypothetical protein
MRMAPGAAAPRFTHDLSEGGHALDLCRRAHNVVEIDSCPLLAPSMERALPTARAIAKALAASGKSLDILVTATASGLDVDIKGHGLLGEAETQALSGLRWGMISPAFRTMARS